MNRHRVLRYATCLLLLIRTTIFAAPDESSFTVPPDSDISSSVAPLAPPQLGEPATLDSLRAKSDELARRFDALDYDPWLRAGELGAGVEPAFRWVRDNVRFESYAGAFRGAKGAYIARAANAADRSLLLAELLKAKGFKTRFATGQLPPDRAAALFDRIFEAPKADAIAATIESPQRRAFLQRVTARARRDYGIVRAALGDGLPTSASPSREQLLQEIASHAWLQAETAGGKWVDLDTSFSDAEPGRTFCNAGATSDALPPDLQQRMTIRVIVERLSGGTLQSDVVLDIAKPVTELVAQQAALFHMPAVQGKGGLAGFGVSPLAGGGTDANPNAKVPALALNMELIRGKPVIFDDGNGPPVQNRGGGIVDLGGGQGEGAPAAAGPQLVAEFLEFELTLPGGAKETTRRVLFDRGGAAWRATAQHDPKALRPLRRDAQGPIDASTIHNVWFSGGSHDMAAYAKRVGRLVHAISEIQTRPAGATAGAPAPAPAAPRRGGGSDGKLDLSGQLFLLGMQNLPVVMIGDQDFIPALNDDPAVRFYLDSPRILLFSLAVDHGDGKTAGPGTIETQIDLRRDKVRGVARDANAMPAVARRKLWFGMLGGALEHEVTSNQSAVMTDGAAAPVGSASALIDRGNPALVVVRPRDAGADAAMKQIPCGPDAALRLWNALEHGDALIVPRDGFAGGNDGGFWAVSTTTGDTRAVWGDDLHATISRSPLPNPMSRRTVTHIIYDDLSSRTVGGTEYPGLVNEVATGTITVGELLTGIGLFVFDCAIWWIALH
jgi:hypothetical protein